MNHPQELRGQVPLARLSPDHVTAFDPWATADAARDVLPDGTALAIVPIGPDAAAHDLFRAQLVEHFIEVSANSRRQRFLHTVPELTPTMLHRLVDTVDNVDHVALSAQVLAPEDARKPLQGQLVGRPIGLARFIRNPERPDTAEVAITVVDAWQRCGVAAVLIRRLGEAAIRRGITTFVADVLATNEAPLALLHYAGLVTRSPIAAGVVHVEVQLLAEELRA